MPTENPAASGRRGLYAAGALLALVGLTDALYLTAQHLAGRTLECSITGGCHVVLASPYATVAGLPVAAFGVAAYFAAFSLATLAAFGLPRAGGLLLLLAALMFAATLWFVFVQAFLLEAWCAYCLLSAAVTTTLLGLAWWGFKVQGSTFKVLSRNLER